LKLTTSIYFLHIYYKGIHINAVTPNGQKFEIQFHSPESLKVKDVIHPMYEEWRNPRTSVERKNDLGQIMQAISSNLQNPKGVDTVQSYKKR